MKKNIYISDRISSITVFTLWDASRDNLSATVITRRQHTKQEQLPVIISQQHELTVSQCLPFDTVKHFPEKTEKSLTHIHTHTKKTTITQKPRPKYKLCQISRVCFIWLSVPLQGLPEDCVQVLLEPDGSHLRYSVEAVEQQPRRCHSHC